MGQAGPGRVCGNCGIVNTAGDQYCSNCGYTLSGGPTDQTVSGKTSSGATVVASRGSGSGGRRFTGALGKGELLGSRYRIVQMIGRGGFGAVYRATDGRFSAQRSVAIKEMSDVALNPSEKVQAIQDFRHEADLLVQLSHPNLPNVSDFFEEAGKAYLVMEFVEGRTLEKVQEDAGGPLDEQQVMGWALQLCAVLDYLHTRPQPVIFRDLKPSNIMLTTDGRLKLIDFGIARIFKQHASKDTTLLGSQGYAPLEQYGRGQSDARSDIYALGATLYDLLVNRLPADAPTRRVNPQVFETPRQVDPRVSPACDAIVLRAMADEPRDRFQSAAEMYQAIVDSKIVPAISTSLSGLTALPMVQASAPQVSLPPNYPLATMQTPLAPPPPALPTGTGGYSGGTMGAQYQVQAPPTRSPGGSYAPPPQGPRVSRRGVLLGGVAAAVALGGGGLYLYANRSASPNASNPNVNGTISLDFVYSTEKDAWMQAAVAAFNKSNPVVNRKAVQLNLDSRGSGDAKDRIASGTLKPVAWSPASTLELNQLISAWKKTHGSQEIVSSSSDLSPTSLVFSPLVFAVWKQRADVLLQKYGAIDWPAISSVASLKNGWADIGGAANWGQIKLGQTRPDQSNSGLLSIALLAYAFFKEQRGLTVEQVHDPAFLQNFRAIEGAVTQFGRSSGTYLEREVILRGPSAYDLTFTYENLVLTLEREARQRQSMPLQLFYPALNIVSDHPFAILQGSWVSQEQQQAAKAFRDFLLAEQQQRLALLSGFRPTNQNVLITNALAGNPFKGQPAEIVIKSDIEPQAQPPGGPVVDALVQEWISDFGGSATSTS